MDIEIWFGIGLIAGGVVSLLFDDPPIATLRNIFFGWAGGIIGGAVMTAWDNGRLPTLDFYSYSILFALVTSVLLISAARLRARIESQKFTPLNIGKLNRFYQEKLSARLIKEASI